MKKKIASISLLFFAFLLMINAVKTVGGCGTYWEWGSPVFFSVRSFEGLPMPLASQTVFYAGNVILSFSVFCIPVFFSGYLLGTSRKKQKNDLCGKSSGTDESEGKSA